MYLIHNGSVVKRCTILFSINGSRHMNERCAFIYLSVQFEKIVQNIFSPYALFSSISTKVQWDPENSSKAIDLMENRRAKNSANTQLFNRKIDRTTIDRKEN